MSDEEEDRPTGAEQIREFMANDPQIEALEISRDEHRIRVATIGQVDEEDLKERIESVLSQVQKDFGKLDSLTLDSGEQIHAVDHRETTVLEKETCETAPKLWQWRKVPWPAEEEDHDEDEWQELAIFAAICGVFGLIGFALSFQQNIPSFVPIILYIIAMIAGGWDAAQDTWKLLRKGKLDIHFLMLAVAVGASVVGAWGEGALLLFLFSVSGAMEHFALYRTRREIDSLFKAAPKEATVIDDDGSKRRLSVSRIQTGQLVLVKPGDVFPLDAIVEDGESAADESTLTGEANPIQKISGDQVFSGTLNLWGVLKARVARPASESSMQKIIRLIRNAQDSKAPSQSFTDKFGTGYTWAVLGLTLAMFLVWWQVFKVAPFKSTPDSFSALYRAMTLLVVVSPCALVLSIPSAILAAIAWGAKNGILFRGGAAVEKLAQVDLVALDKTGTLTTGNLRVQKIESFPDSHQDRLLAIAASLEANSTHPIAKAILTHADERAIAPATVNNFQSLTGMGLRGITDEGEVLLGRRDLLKDGPLKELVEGASELGVGYSEVWIVTDKVAGRFILKDEIRDDSASVLANLKAAGIRPVMLTGDRAEAALDVARQLSLEKTDVHSGLFPEDKVALVQEFGKEGHRVAMVGDGVNDAPSLAAAYVSVAMGGRGSDAALEQSEVVLMNDRIEGFHDAIRLSRKARRIIRQNLIIALGTVILMLILALGGSLPLTLGVFAHEGSTVIVCLNSLRLLLSHRLA
jgi:Cd2+/Zn2+-exporting ATPase